MSPRAARTVESGRLLHRHEAISHPKVGIVILHWNNYAASRRCLDSLSRLAYPNALIYVVDNASEDGSFVRLARRFRGRGILLIRNKENLGFSGGCNRGIVRAVAEGCAYVLLLNNDCVVQNPRFLDSAVRYAEDHPGCGIVGGKISFYPDGKRIWGTGGWMNWMGQERYPGSGEVDKGQCDVSCERQFVSGAQMLIKRSVFERIGLLPEEYFFGKEDWEYSIRARRAGFSVWYDHTFGVLHEGSASHQPSTDPAFVYNHVMRRILFFRRNTSPAFYHCWLASQWIYMHVFFHVKHFFLLRRSTGAMGNAVLHHAMLAGLRDGQRTRAISRQMIEAFRTKCSDDD